MSDADIAEIVRLYQSGMRAYAVADRFGLRPSTINTVLTTSGIRLRVGGRMLTSEQDAAVAREYVAGASMAQLAERYNCHASVIRRALRRTGTVSRKSGTLHVLTAEERATILALCQQGMPRRQIARSLGMGVVPVRRVLEEAGLSGPLSGERHPYWKAGHIRGRGGYIHVRIRPDSPYWCMATVHGYALEHRLVMVEQLGRPLALHEQVHHLNGNKTDNRPENLQLVSGAHGSGQAYHCRCCGSYDVEPVKLGKPGYRR